MKKKHSAKAISEAKGSKIEFQQGQIINAVRGNETDLIVEYKGKKYQIPKKVTQEGSLSLCNGQCLKLDQATSVIGDDRKTPIGQGSPGQNLAIYGVMEAKGSAWVQVDFSGQLGWVEQGAGSIVPKACSKIEAEQDAKQDAKQLEAEQKLKQTKQLKGAETDPNLQGKPLGKPQAKLKAKFQTKPQTNIQARAGQVPLPPVIRVPASNRKSPKRKLTIAEEIERANIIVYDPPRPTPKPPALKKPPPLPPPPAPLPVAELPPQAAPVFQQPAQQQVQQPVYSQPPPLYPVPPGYQIVPINPASPVMIPSRPSFPVSPGSTSASSFGFGFELFYESQLSSSDYKSGLKDQPKPTDDVEYSLPDPFFTNVSKGTGYGGNFMISRKSSEGYFVNFGLGYSHYTYLLTSYANPSNHPDTTTTITFSKLTQETIKIYENYTVVPLGLFFSLYNSGRSPLVEGHSLYLGVDVNLLFFVGKRFEYFEYTGTQQKRTKSETKYLGPPSVNYKGALDLRYQYRFGSSSEIGIGYRYSSKQSHSLFTFFNF